MKLQIQCKSCKATNWLRQYAESRIAFEKAYGSTFEVTCKKCNSKHSYTAKEIRAKSRFIPFFVIALLCLGFYLSFRYLPDLTFSTSNLASNFLLLPAGLIITGLIVSVLLRIDELNKRNFNRS